MPPPVAAPRRRSSPLSHSLSKDNASSGSPTPIPENRVPPPIPPRPHSHKRRSVNIYEKRGLGKSNSMYSPDSLTSDSAHQGEHRYSLPDDAGASAYHPDLQGLDFSKVGLPETADKDPQPKTMYPDISHAFRELKNSSVPTKSQPPAYGMGSLIAPNGASLVQQGARPRMNPTSPAYLSSQASWNNQALYGSMPVAHPSGMTPAVYPPHPNSGYGPPSVSYGMNIQGYPSHQSSGPLPQAGVKSTGLYPKNPQFNSPVAPGYGSNLSQTNVFYETSAAYDLKQPAFNASAQNQFVPSVNSSYVPSALFPPLRPSASNFYDSNHPIAVAGFDESFVTSPAEEDGARDLISLGFPEQEYLSLSQFDPLYSRGRKESVSVVDIDDNIDKTQTGRRDSQISFSFGEAFPNVHQNPNHSPDVSAAGDNHNAEHIWTPAVDKPSQRGALNGPIGFEAFDFDAFGHSKFGSSEEEFMSSGASDGTKFVSAAYDAPSSKTSQGVTKSRKSPEKPPRPPSWRIPQVGVKLRNTGEKNTKKLNKLQLAKK